MAGTNGRVPTGHVKLRHGDRGDVWYARWRDPSGGQHQRALGPAWNKRGRPRPGYFTRATAEARLQEILDGAEQDVARGTSGATFADAAAEFLRFCEHERRTDFDTVKDYRGCVDGYLLPEFGDRSLEEITPDDVDAYKARLLAEGRLSPRTIIRHLTVLHGVFRRARPVWKLDVNPASADLVERPTYTLTGEFDTYLGEEVELLAASADSAQDAALYRVLGYTGLRLGETLGLQWGDIDFVAGLVHVRRNFTGKPPRVKIPKGKRVRSVPMTPRVVDALGRLKERDHFTGDDDVVFATTLGGHLDAWALRRRFYRVIERAGLRRIRLHDLRHAFGTAAIGVLDPLAVQGYMGHAHYSTTTRYLHHKPRPQDAEALERAFGGGDGAKPGGERAEKPVSERGVRGS